MFTETLVSSCYLCYKFIVVDRLYQGVAMDHLYRHILGLSFIYVIYVICLLSLTGFTKVPPWIICRPIDIYWDSRLFMLYISCR